MLVRFTVENCLSFRERVELSMVASKKVRKHPEHVIKPRTPSGIPLLKLAVLYGPNASGKSNLLMAMAMAKTIVLSPVEANETIPVRPFKLDDGCLKGPSRFEFEIKIDDHYYSYGFAVSSKRVEEEWLFEIGGDLERKVFERKDKNVDFGEIPFENDEERQFLRFTAKGTLSNRLFLAECRQRNVSENVHGAKEIKDVLAWFDNRFEVIFPEIEFGPLVVALTKYPNFKDGLARYLKSLDTGIVDVRLESRDSETFDIPLRHRKKIEAALKSREILSVKGADEVEWVPSRAEDGTLRMSRLVFSHDPDPRRKANAASTFQLYEESDGTRRLMELFPAMVSLLTSDMLFAVDELDRSLHPEIVHSYLANFLRYSVGKNSQLIVTTHDTTLLKQNFLRRDEFWLIEKAEDQSSRLVALEEFQKVDESNDLQKDYLHGRFGGVPVIRDFLWLEDSNG